MSFFFLQPIKALFNKKEFFYLIGYSFGSLLILELARILEECGMMGHVLLIDGSPSFLKQLSKAKISTEITDESMQLMLTIAIVHNIFPEESPDEIMSKLTVCKTWNDKVSKLCEFGKASNSEYTENYLRSMTHGMYRRLKMVMEYDTKNVKKIKTGITLVRPTEVAVVEIDEDYELSKYTEGKVNLKFIEGNHITMLDNSKLSDIINECDPNFASDCDFKDYIASGKNT